MTKPLIPADLLKNLQNIQKPEDSTAGTKQNAMKVKPQAAPAQRPSSKPAGKAGGAAHTRSSNRGK
jgi:hypothetical protein